VEDPITIAPLGDDALIVQFADTISWDVGVRVHTAAARVRALGLDSVTDVVPAYTTLAVYFDDGASFDTIASAVSSVVSLDGIEERGDSSVIEIPVSYDGPDIAEVAEQAGLTIADVIERHSSRKYRAYMSGFAPGFVYLGDLDESLVLPRRTVPRVRVPAGSVAIAGAQTAVYPLETPGGWHLIGNTTSVIFDATRERPALIRAGDTVRFVRIGS
jgi:inhibitor of KinA